MFQSWGLCWEKWVGWLLYFYCNFTSTCIFFSNWARTCLFQTVARWWAGCQMWSPSWRRRCVRGSSDYDFCLCTFKCMHAWQRRSHLVTAADPELNMHSVRRPQTAGVMAEGRERSGAWRSGKVPQEIASQAQKLTHFPSYSGTWPGLSGMPVVVPAMPRMSKTADSWANIATPTLIMLIKSNISVEVTPATY